ncbi:MAG TPA: hypothetical protein VN783_12365, partial [Thermoanaerobaculia bacterium]|nr:hypothetical protein [Thermoanaerobaculia bacterium]
EAGDPARLRASTAAAAPLRSIEIVERGELSTAAAAAELEVQVLRPGAGKVGIHFRRQGADVYWLADPASDQLEERFAGASGTRLKTVWKGNLRDRLRWARGHGDPDVPGLPAAERTNLYH